MRSPAISIVIPVFQGARFLHSSVGSCLRELQSGLDVEILAVDDGSSDDSVEILRSFGAGVCVASTEPTRAGRNHARNQGLALARGRYVKFLDQDDDLWPDALREEVALAEATSADVVVSACRLAPFGSDEVGTIVRAPEFERGIDSLLAGESAFTAAALYRREHLVGCQWEESAGKLDDWRFFVSVALNGGRIVSRPGIAYTWRKHPEQHSLNYDLLANARAFYRTLNWLEAELKKRGELTQARLRRLAQYRYKELGILGRFAPDAFDLEIKRILDLDPHFQPRDEERRIWMRLAARVLGLRAAMIVNLAIRRLVKGADLPAPTGQP